MAARVGKASIADAGECAAELPHQMGTVVGGSPMRDRVRRARVTERDWILDDG
ncbi:MAG: hypothetical protein ACRDQ4_24010 [Pseudonocardiaceae bacterium]